jgi:hypothetical protein
MATNAATGYGSGSLGAERSGALGQPEIEEEVLKNYMDVGFYLILFLIK